MSDTISAIPVYGVPLEPKENDTYSSSTPKVNRIFNRGRVYIDLSKIWWVNTQTKYINDLPFTYNEDLFKEIVDAWLRYCETNS